MPVSLAGSPTACCWGSNCSTFGVAVGDLAGESGQQNEGNGKTDPDDSLAAGTELSGPRAINDHERQDALDDVVVHRTKEL